MSLIKHLVKCENKEAISSEALQALEISLLEKIELVLRNKEILHKIRLFFPEQGKGIDEDAICDSLTKLLRFGSDEQKKSIVNSFIDHIYCGKGEIKVHFKLPVEMEEK